MKQSYCLMATYKCNWNCSYCITNTHEQPDVELSDIMEKLNEIEIGSNVSLSGGEPGLIPYEHMSLILSILKEKNCTITVNTNGLFFKKYLEFDELVESYLFHYSEDLDLDKENIVPKVDKSKVEHMLVVNDNNFHKLHDFLMKHNDKVFSIYAATSNNNKIDGNTLSKRNAFEIYRKYKDILNKESLKNLITTCRETDHNKRLIRL